MVSNFQAIKTSLKHKLTTLLPLETISVIHHSLTEFLKGSTRISTDHDYPILEPGPTHNRLALACISYLQSGCFNNTPSPSKPERGRKGQKRRLDPYDFFERNIKYQALPAFGEYAVKNWHVHVRKSMLAGFDQTETNDALDKFVASEDFDKWTDITETGCDQVTPLFVAVALGLTQYCKVLLARPETNPNQGVMYEPPLYRAAKNGFDDIAKLLIEHGADLNEGDKDGYRALHVAAMHNHPKVVRVLLQTGADPLCKPLKTNNCYDWGLEPSGTPLSKACGYGHVDTVAEILPYLEAEKDVNDALLTAVGARRPDIISLILTHPLADVNKQERYHTPLYTACSRRDSKSIKILLEAGADPNTKIKGSSGNSIDSENSGYTALQALACMGSAHNGVGHGSNSSKHPPEETVEAFELMLRAGADVHHVDPQGNNALFNACDGIAVRMLLDAGASPYLINKEGCNLLHSHHSVDILRHLLERTNIDTSLKMPYEGTTPLLQSLKRTNVEKALLLLEFGADCTGSDREGNGAFHLAVGLNYRDRNQGLQEPLFNQLRQAGADVNMKNNSGCTPLHTLDFQTFNEPLFNLLLEAGLDTEAKNNEGETALFIALRRVGDYYGPKLCEKLTAAGCNINAVDNQGRNLLHALKSTDRKFIQYLVGKGVNPKDTDHEGNTLWHIASEIRHPTDIFPTLLALGIDPERPNHSGRTPLHMFGSKRPHALDAYGFKISRDEISQTTPFDLFLSHITEIDPADDDGITPLHLASTFSQYLTSRLLEVGADLSRCTTEGLTVFHLAARSRQPNILGVLFDFHRKNMNTDALGLLLNMRDKIGRTALVYACASGCIETVNMLIEAGATVDCDQYNVSAWQGCVEFEEENMNWESEQWADGYYYDWSASRAGGVNIEDKTRPKVRVANRNKTWLKHRINAIAERLSSYEIFTNKFLRSALEDAVSRGLDVTVECLEGLRTRSEIAISKELKAKVAACLQKRDQSISTTPHSTRSLQHHRLIFEVEQLTQKDLLNFDGSGPPLLHQIVHDGVISLLENVLTPEIAQKFDNMNWCSEQERLCPGRSQGSIQPLLVAACQRDTPNMDMIRFLVETMGVDVNAQVRVNQYGGPHILHEGALHYLVRGLNWWQTRQALPYLLEKGANVNLQDQEGNTPLRASLDRIKSILFDQHPIRILVSAGADVNSVNKLHGRRGISCLSRAFDDMEMTRYLLEHGGIVTHFDIRHAISKQSPDVLEMLLSHGGPISRDTLEPPFAEKSDFDYVEPKLRDRTRIRSEAQFPLHYLATTDTKEFDKSEKMVNILLKYGADVNARYEDTTMMHCIIKCSRIARLLLARPDVDVEASDVDGCTLLLAASQEQDKTHYVDTREDKATTSLVRTLLDRGANIHARNNNGKNVLHHMLSDQETLLNVSYSTREPPRNVDVGYIATLAPSLVNEQDNDGHTPLHYAARMRIQFVATLLDAGADPRIKNKKGDTPLHYIIRGEWMINDDGAISGLRRKLFERLIALGADIHARNQCGKTPIFNFFRNDDWSYAKVTPEEKLSMNQRQEPRYVDGSLEPPLYSLFEQMDVSWTDVDDDDQSLLHVVAAGDKHSGSQASLKRFQFLMNKGLDVAAEDKKGRTPLDVAATFRNAEILNLFKKEGFGDALPPSPSVHSVGSLFD